MRNLLLTAVSAAALFNSIPGVQAQPGPGLPGAVHSTRPLFNASSFKEEYLLPRVAKEATVNAFSDGGIFIMFPADAVGMKNGSLGFLLRPVDKNNSGLTTVVVGSQRYTVTSGWVFDGGHPFLPFSLDSFRGKLTDDAATVKSRLKLVFRADKLTY